MATGNVISICNRALLSIGARSQISNLNEGSTQANACAVLFTPTYESLARTANWNCLRKQVTLSLLGAAAGTAENQDGTALPLPPSPWLYSYQYPSDCLRARFIVPTLNSNSTGSTPISSAMISSPGVLPLRILAFEVGYATDAFNNPITIVLTNQPQAQLVYTVNQSNPQIWDSMFQQAMVASLAAYLVPALSLNLPLAQLQISVAEKLINQARVTDGDEGTTSQDHIPDWIRARNAGTGYGYNSYNSYDPIIWPG